MMKMKKLAIYKISELNSHYYKKLWGLGWSGGGGVKVNICLMVPFFVYTAYWGVFKALLKFEL